MPRVIVDEQNPVGRCSQSADNIIEQRHVPFALPEMITVEDVVEPLEEIVSLIQFVQHVRLVAEDADRDLLGSQFLYQVNHPVSDEKPGENFVS